MQTARITGPASLGTVLREARAMRGLTQTDLAHYLGVSQRYIFELEQGKPTKALERLFEYMQETGVRLYAQLDGDEGPADAAVR